MTVEPGPRLLEIGFDTAGRSAQEGHDALLVPLAPRPQKAGLEVQVQNLQPTNLAGPQAAAVAYFKYRGIPNVQRLGAPAGVEQALDLRLVEDARLLLRLVGKLRQGEPAILALLHLHKTHPGAQRRDGPLLRGAYLALLLKLTTKGGDLLGIRRIGRKRHPLAEAQPLAQIRGIALRGETASAPLVLKVEQKIINHRLGLSKLHRNPSLIL